MRNTGNMEALYKMKPVFIIKNKYVMKTTKVYLDMKTLEFPETFISTEQQLSKSWYIIVIFGDILRRQYY